MLSITNIEKANNYLKHLNKDNLKIDTFINKFKNIITDISTNINITTNNKNDNDNTDI